MKVRTRVAPSPTGDPHVGTAYIALFNYCLAKKHGGEFILRIEDTDQVRSTRQSEDRILQSLKWFGVEWDEGPDCGGPHGPYRQSERSEIYAEYIKQLLDSGHAFRCFCTRERLAQMRAEQRTAGSGVAGYDGLCAHISADESQSRAVAGEEHVVRMKVPRDGVCVIDDAFRGTIEIEWATVDMQVLMKSDGLPTYHLANVVDDHLMQITHVMRGEEWISSAPKHLLLYEYFGWQAPKLAHLPLLRNPDKSKLSKRKNPTSILYYERMGYLPEALLNYLGMMAFSMPDEREKFSLDDMVEAFELSRVSLGGPVFDVDKLTWLNGKYIREDLDDDAFAQRVAEWALNPAYLRAIMPMIRERIDRWSDLAQMTVHMFEGVPQVEPDVLRGATKLDDDTLVEVLQFATWQLEGLHDWSSDTISATLRATAEAMELKLRDFLKPLFVAMSGKQTSTPLFDTMAVLGPDLTRARVRNALTAAGGVSKKKAKKLQSRYDELFGRN